MVEIYDKAEIEQRAQFSPIRLVYIKWQYTVCIKWKYLDLVPPCSLNGHVLKGVVPKGDGEKKPYNI